MTSLLLITLPCMLSSASSTSTCGEQLKAKGGRKSHYHTFLQISRMPPRKLVPHFTIKQLDDWSGNDNFYCMVVNFDQSDCSI